jgi:CHAD domain-containing protein
LLARLLGDLDKLPPELVIGPVHARIQQFVGGALATGTAEATKVLDSDRYLTLLERLVDGAWTPRVTHLADQPAQTVLPPLVRKAWRRLGTGVARVRQTRLPGDYHEVRIQAKRARYAAEAVVPAFGHRAERFAKQIVRIQDVLGEHQDATTTQDTLRRMVQTSSGRSVGFTCGLLHAHEEQRAAKAREKFDELWPEVARRRYRAWL